MRQFSTSSTKVQMRSLVRRLVCMKWRLLLDQVRYLEAIGEMMKRSRACLSVGLHCRIYKIIVKMTNVYEAPRYTIVDSSLAFHQAAYPI